MLEHNLDCGLRNKRCIALRLHCLDLSLGVEVFEALVPLLSHAIRNIELTNCVVKISHYHYVFCTVLLHCLDFVSHDFAVSHLNTPLVKVIITAH